jgi:hypothetical protein
MRWGDEIKSLLRAYRPSPDTIIGPDRRFRHPEEQAEVEYRVVVYAGQVERWGRIIRWLPWRGSGQSLSTPTFAGKCAITGAKMK